MTEPAYWQAIREYIEREARPPEKFGHQPRLDALTRQIGAGLDYDGDVVFAAAWLHDLGVFVGHRPEDPEALACWDNVRYAMDKVPDILRTLGFPAAKIPAVNETIRTHQPAGEPTTIEGAILRDADILEQLGAVSVLRTVCKIGRDSRFPSFTEAVNSLENSLAKLPGQIRLESARKLAQPRIETLRAFLAAVQNEAQDALF